MNRPTGRIRLWRNGLLVFERKNLVVNTGLTAFAEAASGNNSFKLAALGFGSGTTAPAVTDTDLAGPQKYYNATTGATFPSAGTVQVSFALETTDVAAVGLNIQELGLFANSAASGLPVSAGIVSATWAASHAFAAGALILDSNGDVQEATVGGNSGSAQPAWPTVVGNTVTDGTVTWKCVALKTAPTPMVAHAVVPSFSFTGAAAFTGSWAITF